MDIAAISLGANMIEKTITENRTIRGCEHSFSLEEHQINDFASFNSKFRDCIRSKSKKLFQVLFKTKKSNKKITIRLKKFKKGSIIQLKDFDMRRPGNGLNFADFLPLMDLS